LHDIYELEVGTFVYHYMHGATALVGSALTTDNVCYFVDSYDCLYCMWSHNSKI